MQSEMNLSQSRYDEMREQCVAWHRQHPEVWDLFVQYAFQMIDAGRKHYGAKAIWERIRWEMDTRYGEGEFKMNNNYTSFYVRLFQNTWPVHADFFRTREQKSKARDATNLPPLGPEDFD